MPKQNHERDVEFSPLADLLMSVSGSTDHRSSPAFPEPGPFGSDPVDQVIRDADEVRRLRELLKRM